MEHLYLIQSKVTGAVKIGRSQDPEERLKSLQTGSPYELRLILVLQKRGAHERSLHKKLARWRLRRDTGEWFAYEGLAELPSDIYEQLDLAIVDSWWR